MPIGKKKTVVEVDYDELESLIECVYGREVELVVSEEWGNYEAHTFSADGKLDKYEEAALLKFQEEGYASFGITRVLLNDLVRKGEIEASEYVVSIFW